MDREDRGKSGARGGKPGGPRAGRPGGGGKRPGGFGGRSGARSGGGDRSGGKPGDGRPPRKFGKPSFRRDDGDRPPSRPPRADGEGGDRRPRTGGGFRDRPNPDRDRPRAEGDRGERRGPPRGGFRGPREDRGAGGEGGERRPRTGGGFRDRSDRPRPEGDRGERRGPPGGGFRRPREDRAAGGDSGERRPRTGGGFRDRSDRPRAEGDRAERRGPPGGGFRRPREDRAAGGDSGERRPRTGGFRDRPNPDRDRPRLEGDRGERRGPPGGGFRRPREDRSEGGAGGERRPRTGGFRDRSDRPRPEGDRGERRGPPGGGFRRPREDRAEGGAGGEGRPRTGGFRDRTNPDGDRPRPEGDRGERRGPPGVGFRRPREDGAEGGGEGVERRPPRSTGFRDRPDRPRPEGAAGEARAPRSGGFKERPDRPRPSGDGPPRGRGKPPGGPRDRDRKGGGRKSGGKGEVSGLPSRVHAASVVVSVLAFGKSLEDAELWVDRNVMTEPLMPRDRAQSRMIAATTLRHLGEIEKAVAPFLDRPLPKEPALLRAILYAGAAQLLYMETPPHAAINLAVEHCGRNHETARFEGLINALLRRVSGAVADGSIEPDPVANVPEWMYARWVKAYGEADARRIAEASLHEAALDLTPKDPADAEALATELSGLLLPTGTVRVESKGRIEALPGFAEGRWWVQDAAAALPARLLGDVTGQTVVDLCAAPGGKTLELAARGAKVTAVDISLERLGRIRQNLARLSLAADIVEADAAIWLPDGECDAVLVDVPCTATGTIRRHPDILRLKRSEDVAKLAEAQRRILLNAFRMVRPGGLVVYCSCSLEPEEGVDQIGRFLAGATNVERVPVEPGEAGIPAEWLTPRGELRTLPFHLPNENPALAGLDGFYAVRLRRTS